MKAFTNELTEKETIGSIQVDTDELELQEEMSQKEENHFDAIPRLKAAYLQALFRKRAIRNPRYLLLARRARFAAYRAARDLEPMPCLITSSEEGNCMNTEDIFPNQIFQRE